MHTKVVVVGLLAAASVVVAQEPAHLVPRDDASSADPTQTKQHRSQESWESQDPAKASKYHADMKSLHSSIKANPMYTSMKGALKTGVPQSYKDAIATNPGSIYSQYQSTQPPWMSALPKDVRSFMEANQKAAMSIRDKDVGPIATDAPRGQSAAQGAEKKDPKKSEASALGLIGATIGTLAGALGVAMLLL